MEPTHFWREVGIGLIPNGIAALAGFLLAYFVRDRLFNPYRFGGWRVRVLRGDKELTARDIGWRKAQAIADDVSELSVFLKGVVSPYAWVTCDIVAEGQAVGLLRIDPKPKGLFFKTRTYTIDVAQNPLPDKSRFQGWRVRLLRAGRERVNRPVSPGRMESVLGDPDTLAAFARDVAAPFEVIRCDLVDEGQRVGLLAVDPEGRVITIDLDKNPAPENAP